MKSLVLYVVFAFASVASAQTYKPVIVFTNEMELDAATRRLLVETFSSALQTGVMRGLAKEFSGTGGHFAAQPSQGVLSAWRGIQREMDLSMAQQYDRIKSQLRAPRGAYAESRIDLFWTARDFDSPLLPASDNGLSSVFAMTKGLATGVAGINPFALQLGESVLRMQMVASADVDGGVDSFFSEAGDAYRSLREQFPGTWFPLHMAATIRINAQKQVTTRFEVDLMPKGFEQINEDTDASAEFFIEKMVYKPGDWGNQLGVMQLSVERLYGGTASAPTLKIRFAEFGNHLQFMLHCILDDCLRQQQAIPTVYVTIKGSDIKQFFANALSLYQFRILISAISLDLNTLKVVAEDSEMPIAVKTYGGSWKIVDQNRNRGFNPLTLMQRTLVGQRVAANVQDKIDSAEASMEMALSAFMGPIRQVVQ